MREFNADIRHSSFIKRIRSRPDFGPRQWSGCRAALHHPGNQSGTSAADQSTR